MTHRCTWCYNAPTTRVSATRGDQRLGWLACRWHVRRLVRIVRDDETLMNRRMDSVPRWWQ